MNYIFATKVRYLCSPIIVTGLLVLRIPVITLVWRTHGEVWARTFGAQAVGGPAQQQKTLTILYCNPIFKAYISALLM